MDKKTAIARRNALKATFHKGCFVAHDFDRGTCVYRVKHFFVHHLSSDDCTINCDADFGYNIDGEILFDHTFGAHDKVRFANADEIIKLWGLYNQVKKEQLLAKEKNFLPSEIMWVIYSLIKWESENEIKDNFLIYMDENKQYSPTLENVVEYCKLHKCMDNFINYLFPSDTSSVHPIYHFIKEISMYIA